MDLTGFGMLDIKTAVLGQLLAILLIACSTSVGGHPASRADLCTPLTNTELAEQLSRYEAEQSLSNYHDSFYTLGACKSNALKQTRHTIGRPQAIHVDNLNSRCPQNVNREGLCTESTSSTPSDENQYPPSLMTKQCQCDWCGIENNWGRCEGVPYFQRVLRRQEECDAEGKQVWRGGIAKIYLGCVCGQDLTS